VTTNPNRYADLKAQGLCTRCGKKRPSKDETRCGWCKAKVNRARKAREARAKAEAAEVSVNV
jgi:uncharacterized paraquat-inducible protein A